jgi:hypothetical protein
MTPGVDDAPLRRSAQPPTPARGDARESVPARPAFARCCFSWFNALRNSRGRLHSTASRQVGRRRFSVRAICSARAGVRQQGRSREVGGHAAEERGARIPLTSSCFSGFIGDAAA